MARKPPYFDHYESSRKQSYLEGITLVIIVTAVFAGGQIYKSQISSTPAPPTPLVNAANVYLPDPRTGAETLIVVSGANGSGALDAAMRHLANEDYNKARSELESAIASGDKTYEAFFALAVTYEKLGRHAYAIINYKLASIAKSTPDATAGRKRCEAALGIRESTSDTGK
jgi:hypothetical protein